MVNKEDIDARKECICIVFLNAHAVKLLFEYLCLYLQICATISLGHRNLLPWIVVNRAS